MKRERERCLAKICEIAKIDPICGCYWVCLLALIYKLGHLVYFLKKLYYGVS